jgi:peptidoglycan-N-acetylglucosamine deacetylase
MGAMDSGAYAWPGGATGAVSLTYDGSLPEHLEIVVPLLDKLGFKATFYLCPTNALAHPVAWRRVVASGHEVGSHSLFGVTDDGSLRNWTLSMVRDDLSMTQAMIREVFGVFPTTFAYPGETPDCHEGSYRIAVEEMFETARSAITGANDPRNAVLRDLRQLRVDGWPESKVGRFLSEERKAPWWEIYTFDRFFATESMLALDAHDRLCRFLDEKRDSLWIAPVSEVASYVREHALAAQS